MSASAPTHPASELVAQMERRAQLRRAQERLGLLREMRDARRLAQAGLAQRDIAETLHTTQPRVHRLLRAARRLPDEMTPEEVILEAVVDGSDRDQLVEALSSMTFTWKKHAPEPFDGAVSGTWEQVRAAMVAGFLTRQEYERIRAAVNPPY